MPLFVKRKLRPCSGKLHHVPAPAVGPDESAGEALRIAAALIERTAYDEAGQRPAPVISQLILISAELERLAQRLSKPEERP